MTDKIPGYNDPYSENHVDDPVTADAVAAAMAATDPKTHKPRWYERFFILIIVVIVLLGTAGAVLGAINTVSLHNETEQLKAQQDCVIKLDRELQIEQSIRNDIAADDRAAVDNLITAVVNVTSHADLLKAEKKYFAERAANDKRRNQLLTLLPDVNSCSLIPAGTDSVETPPVIPSNTSSKTPTSKPSVSTAKTPKAHKSVARKSGGEPRTQPVGQSHPTAVRTTTVVAAPKPQPTKVVTQPAAPQPSAPNAPPPASSPAPRNPVFGPVLGPVLTPIVDPIISTVCTITTILCHK